MSDETEQAEYVEAGDFAQPPEFHQDSSGEVPVPPEPEAPTEPALKSNSDEVVRQAALEAERTVTESQYSEGLGSKE